MLNALAAIAVATELEIDDAAIARALAEFQGIDRRLQTLGELATARGRIVVVDDYAHHPTEIAATLEAARQGWPDRRIVLVFQPHRYTRTRDLLDDFAKVLSEPDALVVAEVYAAGEPPIAGADAKSLCRAIRSRGRLDPVHARRARRAAAGARRHRPRRRCRADHGRRAASAPPRTSCRAGSPHAIAANGGRA